MALAPLTLGRLTMTSDLLDEMIEALRCLPGVGPKSAQRMALHLLQRDRKGGKRLSAALAAAMERIGSCRECRIFTEGELCRWCSDTARDASKVCIVENPADVLAIERATDYDGHFFLLLGSLSPLDGVGPKELGLDRLQARVENGGVKEVTLATSPTIEGQATASYITDMLVTRGVTVLQIARGMPMGSELEFVDGGTLSVAFAHRTAVK